MGLLLLVAGSIAIAGGLGAFAYAFADPAFGRLHTATATIAVVGGLGVVGLGALIASLQRLAEAIEVQMQHLRSIPAPEPRPAAVASMGAAAVAAALGDPLSPGPSRPREAVPPFAVPSARPEALELREVSNAIGAAVDDAPESPPIATPLSDSSGTASRSVAWPGIDDDDHVHPPGSIPVQHSSLPFSVPPTSPSRPEPVVPGFDAIESPHAAETHTGPQVLKAGVIEGMAYTLYSDGSVDAELPEGTRHFASIAEWRSYLREGV